MSQTILFTCLSTTAMRTENPNSGFVTLQIIHNGESAVFPEASSTGDDFHARHDAIINSCMGSVADDEDLKYARKMIKLCKKIIEERME